jgi:hypothetical protein
LGIIFIPRIYKAVDFPIQLQPTNPKTYPGLGVGNLWSLKEFFPYLCIISLVISLGKLIIFIAYNGNLLIHNPHPMHKYSSISTQFD